MADEHRRRLGRLACGSDEPGDGDRSEEEGASPHNDEHADGKEKKDCDGNQGERAEHADEGRG